MASLAVKYRPQTFEDVCEQSSIIKILERQLEIKEFKNCYLFCGPSGCGKTTIARIFANKINNGSGQPIEIDGASNNGVENVKTIIQGAKERSLDSEYKIYIVDECHSISSQGWQAFLKCIEEPPKYTIFIFCTTDPQKIPATILNRVMRFNLTRVKTNSIMERLKYVCKQEGFANYDESCDYISKMACGGVRDALAMLEKCAGFSNDLCILNVLQCLGNFSYQTFFDLTNFIIDGKEQEIIGIVENCYSNGNDLSLFINQYLEFVLDLTKYCIFRSMDVTKIPLSLEESVKYAVNIENNTKFYNSLSSRVLKLSLLLRNDVMPKTTTEIGLLEISRGV